MIFKLRVRLHLWLKLPGMTLWQALAHPVAKPNPKAAAKAIMQSVYRRY
jgi:hypothetical protein